MLALLKLGGASSGRPDREKLRAAIAAHDAAKRAVPECEATLARLEAIINTSDTAARTAESAAHAATEARRLWVREGCRHSGMRELERLDDAASEAADIARRAAADADIVRKTGALKRAEEDVSSAQAGVRHCEAEISAAIGVLLVEELAPELEQFEELAKKYRAARLRIVALKRLLSPFQFSYMPDFRHASGAAHAVIEATLSRAMIKSVDDECAAARAHAFVTTGERSDDPDDDAVFERFKAPFRARAEALRNDPDA